MVKDTNVASNAVKAVAFFGLVGIQTCIGMINKIAFISGGGHFTFAPTSALTIAEFVKFLMSLWFHINDYENFREHDKSASLAQKWNAGKVEIFESFTNSGVLFNIWTLAFLYCFNNQLNFYLNVDADPGSIFLFKSGSTFITAIMLKFFLYRPVSQLQWAAIVMQVAGLIVVQYDPCKGQPILATHLYIWMTFSTFITATNAVRNDHLLKNYKISMHVQNMILYGGGVLFNLSAFLMVPKSITNTPENIGFFEGYDSIWALLVIFFNALIGLAISAVYKYCDAVIKTFATATVTVLLVVFSAVYLHKEPTLVAWMGVTVVAVSTWMYSKTADPKKPDPKLVAPADQGNGTPGVQLDEKDSMLLRELDSPKKRQDTKSVNAV